MSDFTKSAGTSILDWTELDDTASDTPYAGTGVQTCPDDIEIVLDIVVAHKDTNDGSTNYVTVNVWRRVGTTDEDWQLFTTFQTGGGQATAETLNANSGSGVGGDESEIHVADTTDWDTGNGETLFLLDSGTLANSCLVTIKGWSDNAHYNADHDLVNAYDNADILHDGVSQHSVLLPASTVAYKVATYAVRVRESKVTDIE
jgi:hypothetical protein